MKRAFLLFGIVSFISAKGQQKDLFDIDTHLKKKIGTIKQHSQNTIASINQNNNRLQLNLKQILPNGDKVFTSPSYHMPVIVPGNSLVYNMPTRFIPGYKYLLQKQPNHIPNPAIENLVIIY